MEARMRVAVEERVAYLEGQAQQLPTILTAMREDIVRVETRIDRIDDRMGRQFLWLVGLHITTLLAIVGALFARG
jgi:hypothetical protein